MQTNTTRSNAAAIIIFAVLALFVAGFGFVQAALKTDVSGNFVFSSFSTTSGAYNVPSSTSTTLLATTTLKNRSFAQIFNTSSTTIYCNVNGMAAATTTSFPIAASSTFSFTVADPYQGALRCINSGTGTGTAYVLETGL